MPSTTLVIVTTHFGYHFSGGSTATCEIFTRLQHRFDHIHVIGTECGEHHFESLTFHRYRTITQALERIRHLRKPDTVFYGDFYTAWMLALLKTNYYFTYHDNWPEQALLSWRDNVRSRWLWPLYRYIFTHALAVFTVSEFKFNAIRTLNANTYLVHNGFNRSFLESGVDGSATEERAHIVMAGNIDARKYQQAIALFQALQHSGKLGQTQIHIYGHTIDSALATKLASFPFVHLMGHQRNVPFHQYEVMLHTSVMENLSLAWCEALYAGTTIVSFDVGGAREIINPNQGHHLIEPFDTRVMADALIQALSSPAKARHSGERLESFCWESAATAYEAVMLDSTMGQSPHG